MKKNQFALIFLTLVVMLAVWYIKSPLNKVDKGNNNPTDAPVISTRVAALTSLRDSVREERSLEVASLDTIIASADTTVLQKEEALNKKQSISDLTEKEVLLELTIMNLGYQDAFVHATKDGVEVIIVADEENADVVVEIIGEVMKSFEDTTNVVVNFKSLTELSNN
ncbi:MAG: SpoIIIAH-like family protein [Bacilli bacterium]|nr:SpoIIIAH-like family protein [Bacilli bacterium]